MSQVKIAAVHKKKAGMLTVFEEESPPRLNWKCIDDSLKAPIVDLVLDKITHLQVSPATNENIVLRILLNEEAAKEMNLPKPQLLFSFSSRDAMNEIKGILQQAISRRKTVDSLSAADASSKNNNNNNNNIKPNENVENDKFLAELLDERKLLKNLTLQQRLLTENSQLMKTFSEAVIKSGLDPEEFWSTRVHLLRSYAIQNNQKRGPYNVLSTIKPVASSENQVNVSVTREKIHEIFQQYPVVRKAYDENVPKISEGEFWSRFFSSKLFRKLRGEKINLYDRGDVTMDKYLQVDPDYDGEEDDDDPLNEDLEKLTKEDNVKPVGKQSKRKAALEKEKEKDRKRKKIKLFSNDTSNVSKFIDVYANEEDAEIYGNTPDITMKQNKDSDIVGVMRSMNRLSRRMMSGIKDDSVEKENEEELEIKDLEDIPATEYNELNYTTRTKVDSLLVPEETIKELTKQSPLNPNANSYNNMIEGFKSQLTPTTELCLQDVSKNRRKEIFDATKDISNLVKNNAKQSAQSWKIADSLNNDPIEKTPDSNGGASTDAQSKKVDEFKDEVSAFFLGLDQSVIDILRISHSTSIEFLRHFWLHFNSISGSTMSTNPNFKSELLQLRKLYFSIQNCSTRVASAIDSLSEEDKTKVSSFMTPLTHSLNEAMSRYEKAIPDSEKAKSAT